MPTHLIAGVYDSETKEFQHAIRHLENARMPGSMYVADTAAKSGPKHRAGHSIPKGCQWSPDCDECPWGDCILPGNTTNPMDYRSKEAIDIRKQFLKDMMFKMDAVQLAGILKVHPRTVWRVKREMQGKPDG